MIQIVKELIRYDYGMYWQETGVNKRLKVYKALSIVAEALVYIIAIVIAVMTLELLLQSLGNLIDSTSGIYDYYTAEELKYSVGSILKRLLPLCFIAFSFSVIIKCIKNSNTILFNVKQELMWWINNLPFAVIYIFLVCCLVVNEFDYAYCSLITILIFHLLRKVLNAFANRVNMMELYALGLREVGFVLGSGRGVNDRQWNGKYNVKREKNDDK